MGLSVVGFCTIFMGACSNQGEGDRCDTQNGNDDCQDGLECVQGTNICCPVDRSTATAPGCQTAANPGGEAGIPAEASTFDANTSDSASSDASDTGTPDSGDDAADANDDGG